MQEAEALSGPMKVNRDSYDSRKAVSIYSKHWDTEVENMTFGEQFRVPDYILDLGCGAGRTFRWFGERGFQSVGVDMAPKMVEAARRLHPDSLLVVGDASNLCFRDDVFRYVLFSYNGMGNIYPEGARLRCLRDVRRILKKGGVFVFSSHNELWRRRNPKWNKPYAAPYYIHRFSYGDLVTYYIMREDQFKQLEENGYYVLGDYGGKVAPWIYYAACRRRDVMATPWTGRAEKLEREWRAWGHRYFRKAVTDTLEKLYEGGRILDVGCGAGVLYSQLSPKLREAYVGADFTADFVDLCRKRYPDGEWRHADITDLPFPSGSFGVVNTTNVLQHVPDWRKAAGELMRVSSKYVVNCERVHDGPTQVVDMIPREVLHRYFNPQDLVDFYSVHGRVWWRGVRDSRGEPILGLFVVQKGKRDWEAGWGGMNPGDFLVDAGDVDNPQYEVMAEVAAGYGKTVLDVGCGTCNAYPHLKRRGMDYVGVDFTDEFLDECTDRYPGIKVRHASAFSLPFGDACFDVVFVKAVFEHMHPGEWRKALREAARVAGKALVVGWFRSPGDMERIDRSGRTGFYSNWYEKRKVVEAVEGLPRFKSLSVTEDVGPKRQAVYAVEFHESAPV